MREHVCLYRNRLHDSRCVTNFCAKGATCVCVCVCVCVCMCVCVCAPCTAGSRGVHMERRHVSTHTHTHTHTHRTRSTAFLIHTLWVPCVFSACVSHCMCMCACVCVYTHSVYRGQWEHDVAHGCGVKLWRRYGVNGDRNGSNSNSKGDSNVSWGVEEGKFLGDEYVGPVMACR